MRRIMKNYNLIGFICLAVTLFSNVTFAAGQGKASGPGKARSVFVVSEKVASHEISQSLTLIGKLKARQSVSVSAEVSGKVAAISMSANQQVEKGDILIRLNDEKAKASVVEATAYLSDEKRKLTEFERLAKKGAITQTEIDAQKASVDIALARLDAANASLKQLNIEAPFSGTVGFIDFSLGKMVSSGTELVTLDNLSVMQLDLLVPERYLSMLSKGMRVEATTNAWSNTVFRGELVGIDSRINSETLNLKVRIDFDNTEQKLKPGMLMSGTLQFPALNAPVIPVQALQYSGTKRYVYVINGDNKAIRTEVTLGARVGNEVVIEKGLEIGERIVVQGIVNMRDGVEVKEQNGQTSAKKGSE